MMKAIFRPSKGSFKRFNWLISRSKGSDIEGFSCDEVHIPTRDEVRELRIRIYRRKEVIKRLPAILYLHGGGYAIGCPEGDHDLIEFLLNNQDCIVISPDYRLSLDDPYPAAIEDCYDTLTWIVENSDARNIDTSRIFVGGVSAGGGLTVALAMMARDKGYPKIAGHFPIYPMLDHRGNKASMRDNNGPVWSEKHNQLAWDLYLGDMDRDNIPVYASPAMQEDYSGLPPAFTYVGSLDPFLDETLEYVENLRKAGVAVKCKVFEGAYHGFDQVAPNAEVSKEAWTYLGTAFNWMVESYTAVQSR